MLIHWIVSGVTGNQASGYRSNLASNRYRAILPAEGLRQSGHTVDFIEAGAWNPAAYQQDSRPDVVVIGKLLPGTSLESFLQLSERLRNAAELARKLGCLVVADINDDHFQHPQLGTHWRGVVECADGISVGSEAMAERVKQYASKPVYVIGDPVAANIAEPSVFQRPTGFAGLLQQGLNRFGYMSERLRLAWFGSHTNWRTMAEWAEKLVVLAQEQPYSINVISAPGMGIEAFVDQYNLKHEPNALMQFTPWEGESVWEHVSDSHMVLIPSDLGDDRKKVKTANRLVDALACGRFVVASPVPAYKKYEEFVWLGDDPVAGVKWAITNSNEVARKIRDGQRTTLKECGLVAIAKRWEAMFMVLTGLPRAEKPPMAARMPAASNEMPQENHAIVKLNLGCGDKILDGYINVDVAPSRGGKAPDVLCDLHKLDQFSDNSADEILAVHVVEHFWRWEILGILKEWSRVLKPGAAMVLECPNLISACEEFLKNPDSTARPDKRGQRTMWVFYGDPAWSDPLMVHRWGYTPDSLAAVMAEAGLVNIRQEPAQFKLREPRDMRLVGEKPIDNCRPSERPASGSTNSEIARSSIHTTTPIQKEQAIWDGYLSWYYQSNVWKHSYYHGVRTLKLPSDMWNYQEIIFERGIRHVIETGTRHGGSALFFADALAACGGGPVITIDVDAESRQIKNHPGIHFVIGSSCNAEVVDKVLELLPKARGPVFLILDSDHSRDHVYAELEVWVPVLRAGDYLVVEDTNVNGHPVRPDHGPGPWEAITEYISDHPGLLHHDFPRERKFGATAAPDGYYVRI